MGLESKADHSPIVTRIDRQVEEALRREIFETYPTHGVSGEELGSRNPNARYLWVIDPVDGTIPFLMGRPSFGTVIALFDKDRPVLGLVDQPILRERWIGLAGRKTCLNGVPLLTSQITALQDAFVALNGAEYLCRSEPAWKQAWSVLTSSRLFCFGGDCYNFGLLASGIIDIVIEAEPDLCDFAAMVPIVEGAGGKMTGWFGETLSRTYTGGVVAASCAELHGQALALLQR